MTDCTMAWARVLDYHDGRADEPTRARVAEHLVANCPNCAAHLAQAVRLTGSLSAGVWEHAPADALERARALFRERVRPPVRVPLLARLVFDGRGQTALAGARGAEDAAFSLLYEAGDYEIDVWQERQDDGFWYLIGSARSVPTGETVVPARVELRGVDDFTRDARLESGEFHVADVPSGLFQLVLTLADTELTLPEVAAGGQSAVFGPASA